jgi:pyruvate dehydrogenase E1 component alpha subunit
VTKKKSTTPITPDKASKFYHDMLLIRRFEERAGQLYGRGLIGGFCHLYIGQEAIVVGLQSLQNEQDSVITSYRDHGHMLACGMDPKRVMAELTGRRDGYSAGKGGSMHMFSREKNFFGGHGIVGAQVPIGTGMAFAHKYNKDGGVCLTYFGDGAANQGQIYESYNMASLWDLPVLYIIENNQYSMGTSLKRHSASNELWTRGCGFGIEGMCANGMDILNVLKAGEKALSYVRDVKRPFILELDTYRYRGHSMSDPALYRTKEEVTEMKENRDPISSFKNYIQKEKLLTEEKLKEIEKNVKEAVALAVKFAEESPEPDLNELWTDVLIETTG